MNPLYSLTIIDYILPALALLAALAIFYGFWVLTIRESFWMQFFARTSAVIAVLWFSFVNLFIWGMVGI
tara:strand:+ start:40 stop:246 length:207 start_codon:yes stop_codon:yes gene_type:complete